MQITKRTELFYVTRVGILLLLKVDISSLLIYEPWNADVLLHFASLITTLLQELERLSQKFSENVLDATKKYEKLINDKKEIAGLPPTALALAAQAAVSKVPLIWSLVFLCLLQILMMLFLSVDLNYSFFMNV